MRDNRMDKDLIRVLETNDITIASALKRIEVYSKEIDRAVKANLDIHRELFYRRQPSDRPKD